MSGPPLCEHTTASQITVSPKPTDCGALTAATTGIDTLAEVDEVIVNQIADRLTGRVREAVEETDPDAESDNYRRSIH